MATWLCARVLYAHIQQGISELCFVFCHPSFEDDHAEISVNNFSLCRTGWFMFKKGKKNKYGRAGEKSIKWHQNAWGMKAFAEQFPIHNVPCRSCLKSSGFLYELSFGSHRSFLDLGKFQVILCLEFLRTPQKLSSEKWSCSAQVPCTSAHGEIPGPWVLTSNLALTSLGSGFYCWSLA